MIYAYDKLYLEQARNSLGCMIDAAVNKNNIDIDEFFDLFIKSGLATRFEKGDVSVIAGKSGMEIFYDVMLYSAKMDKMMLIESFGGKSPEYWAGWALAYYQWVKNTSFSDIVKSVPLSNIVMLYSPYHEMDIRHFVEKMDELYRNVNMETKLKQKRLLVGLSQSELASVSDVPVRTIQQYEQRQKDINKAAAITLKRLATALYCSIEDLLEIQ